MEKKGCLLVVEPSDAVRGVVALAGRSYVDEVKQARTVAEAGEVLADGADVVVCEFQLPDGNGEDVLRHLKARNDDGVLVAVTAEDDVAEAVRLMRLGAFSVLPKPFGLDEVSETLRRAFEQRRVIAEARKTRELEKSYHDELERQVTEKTALISSLLDFSNSLNATRTMEDAVELLLQTLRRMLRCNRISILLQTPETGQLAVAEAMGLPRDVIRRPIDPAESPVVKRVMEGAEVVFVENVADSEIAAGRGQGSSFMSVPLVDSTEQTRHVFGIVNLTDREGNSSFTPDERRLAESIAHAASIAVANLRNKRSLEKSYFDTVGALALALEAKDPYTHGHSQRVTSMCMIVADVLGFSNEQMDQIMFAGMLHDVGKIGIPESILLKPSRLTQEEFERIREHPAVGERMVGHISFLSNAASIIRHHHERWDGKGYPDGLRGAEIELPARIMAIADSYDAMTTDRSYRRRLNRYQVFDELMKGRGTQFDPECLDVFIKHVAESRSIPEFAM